jgi:hypothetical protein
MVVTTPIRRAELAEAFARDGYLRLPAFVADVEVVALRAEVRRVLAAPLPPGCERPHNTLVPLAWGDELVERVVADRGRRARLRAALAASDLRWISGYVSVKPPHSGPLWWHQDWWCWDHPVTYRRAAPQVAVLCYLSATTVDTGALRVLTGSHRASLALHGRLPEAHATDADRLDERHPAMVDQPGQVSLEVDAGDAVIVDYRLLHGTYPHNGDRRRDCVLLTFAPNWGGLPPDVRGHLVRHPAQPPAGSARRALDRELLPAFDGPPRDLPLSRAAPARFAIGGRDG